MMARACGVRARPIAYLLRLEGGGRIGRVFEGDVAKAARAAAIVRDERVDDLAKLLKGLAQHLHAASEQEK